MSGVSVFFNAKVEVDLEQFPDYMSMGVVPGVIGNFCFSPIRCLCKGNIVEVSKDKGNLTVHHVAEYGSSRGLDSKERNFLHVIASIVFLIPGIILGCFFKGLSYLWEYMREAHKLAVIHFTPIDRVVVGSENNRYNLEKITQALREHRDKNFLNQPTNNLVVYAEPGTEIIADPGFINLNPQKIILVGAKLINGSCYGSSPLHERLNAGWEANRFMAVSNAEEFIDGTSVAQHVKKSVGEAELDVPPRTSFFSCERYKRIYVIK